MSGLNTNKQILKNFRGGSEVHIPHQEPLVPKSRNWCEVDGVIYFSVTEKMESGDGCDVMTMTFAVLRRSILWSFADEKPRTCESVYDESFRRSLLKVNKYQERCLIKSGFTKDDEYDMGVRNIYSSQNINGEQPCDTWPTDRVNGAWNLGEYDETYSKSSSCGFLFVASQTVINSNQISH